jgi:sensor histidine kinase regulating citrate/malate metabolism
LAAFGYAVAFVVVVFAVKNLWWLWLAVTFFAFNLVFGYLLRKQQKYEKREVTHEAVAVSATASFIPAELARTDFLAPQEDRVG